MCDCFAYMYVFAPCVCLCAVGDQKKVLNFLKLELQEFKKKKYL